MIKVSKKSKALVITTISFLILSVVLMIPGIISAQEGTEETATETIVLDIPEKISFDVIFPELSAKAGTNFEFKFDLLYEGDEEATFNMVTEGPEDWYIVISPSYEDKEVNAIKMQPGQKESLKLLAYPPVAKDQQIAGDFPIKVIVSNEDLKISEEYEFIATVTATYDSSLTAKYGVLNTQATSGKNNPFMLVLENTGSGDIENITFKSDAPQKWIIKFEPEKIDKLKAGETKDIEVTITPPDKTIAGDYMLNFASQSEDASNNIDIRVTVETPSIWGWVGIAIIVLVVIGVAVIFARLGRR